MSWLAEMTQIPQTHLFISLYAQIIFNMSNHTKASPQHNQCKDLSLLDMLKIITSLQINNEPMELYNSHPLPEEREQGQALGLCYCCVDNQHNKNLKTRGVTSRKYNQLRFLSITFPRKVLVFGKCKEISKERNILPNRHV